MHALLKPKVKNNAPRDDEINNVKADFSKFGIEK